ncbi:MAG: hypothetical protein J0L78_12530 [Planctomycetes bacterium]|nr:hypothetical protein [Planctomycetota bacterium]
MRSIFCLLVIAIGGTAVAAPPHYRIVAEEWEGPIAVTDKGDVIFQTYPE